MRHITEISLLAIACNPSQQTKLEDNDTGETDTGGTEDTQDTEDTSDTEDTEDTSDTEDTQDTEEPRIVAKEGTWNVTSVQLISDVCDLGDYEDVESFVPEQFQVSSSDETGFNLDPETRCDVDDQYQISCEEQTITENVLWGCDFIITNRFMGELEAENDISVDFNIQIESDGLGCELVELGITGSFPCDIVLYANATPQ